jgi:hypothetical protein
MKNCVCSPSAIWTLSYLQKPVADNAAGLNGLTQHSLSVHVEESTKLNSLKGVDVNGTPPFLGSDGVGLIRAVS